MRGIFQTGLAVVFAATLVFLYATSPDLVDRLTAEDGVFENITALLYLLGGIAFVVAIRRKSAAAGWLVLLALACVFVAGEEISWGQRVFGWSTPDAIAGINVQEEITVHNIEGIHENIRALAVVFVAAFCVVLPVSDRYSKAMSSIYAKMRLPLFPASALAWVAVAIGFMLVPRLVGEHVGALDEIGETALGVAFALFGYHYGSQKTAPAAEAVTESGPVGLQRAS